MKIIKEYPPNIDKIRQVLNPPETACFAYGDIIYNPSGNEIRDDLMVHEETHERQMKGHDNNDWWDRYLNDKQFRQDCEVEAYANQLVWLKNNIRGKFYEKFVGVLADQLTTLYKLDISYYQAFTLLRMKVKDLMK